MLLIWANEYVNNKWVTLDPTGPNNKVGKIVNFNYKTRKGPVNGKGGDG